MECDYEKCEKCLSGCKRVTGNDLKLPLFAVEIFKERLEENANYGNYLINLNNGKYIKAASGEAKKRTKSRPQYIQLL